MLVAISADRWPAVVATELAGVSLFLLLEDFALKPRQVCGLRQVGLRLEVATLGLRPSSLAISEAYLRKCIPDSHLRWGSYRQSDTLSKTTKLILLDSLLQEVCIKSGLAGRSPLSSLRLSVCLVQSQTFFIRD